MTFAERFPATTWVWRCLSSRRARRIYLTILFALIAATAGLRAYMFFLTQKTQAVLSGLAKVRIDLTTEDELAEIVPYLNPGKPSIPDGTSVRRYYFAEISNESGWVALNKLGSDMQIQWWLLTFAERLGYRYFHFSAIVSVLDGKVSKISYGISKEAITPRSPIVSAESFHGLWASHESSLMVSSAADESPQYRIEGDHKSLLVSFAFDAPTEVRSRAFQANLYCFWGLLGCSNAREVAPSIWQDSERIQAAVVARFRSGDMCPDRILEGRMKYLLDVGVARLEALPKAATGIGREVQESSRPQEYKVVEVLRHPGWDLVTRPANPAWWIRSQFPLSGFGEKKALFFGHHWFESCKVVAATPSAVAAVRNASPAPRRHEDQIVRARL